MQVTQTFSKLAKAWARNPRYIDDCGGTRSGKTYSVLQMLMIVVPRDGAGEVTSVVSETMPHLKRGCIREFRKMMQEEGVWEDDRWSVTDKIYTFASGAILEFFSADNPGKVHGPARKRLFINEGQNISYEIARQLFVRTTGMIIVDYNPTHSFWMHEHITARDNCISIHSVYKDNTFLTPEQVNEIESNRSDKNWWRVYGEGKVGMLEGLIYDFEQIDEMPPKGADKPERDKADEELYADSLTEVWGLDFGFTNDPTAIVRVLADTKRKRLYIDEKCYRTMMLNDAIAGLLKAEVPERSTEVYADCAEPKSIEEIRREGVNILSCDKDAPVRSDKMKYQIQWMQGWKLYVTKWSLNLINELRNYTWAKDRDGNMLNIPIDKYNHLLDALRYAVWSRFGRNAGKGNYNITTRRRR